LLKKISIAIFVLALLGTGAFFLADKIVNDRIIASAELGTLEGQTQGVIDGGEDGAVAGEAEGKEAGYRDGTDDGSLAGTGEGERDGSTDGEQDGSTDGYRDGTADGADQGSTEGYADGESEGLQAGYDDGFQAGFNTTSLLRNVTYPEVIALLSGLNATTAHKINNEGEEAGIRVAYVAYELAGVPDGYYEAVAFDTIDAGLVYFSPDTHDEMELTMGKSLSAINGFPRFVTNDTITQITVIW
jgi:hypothetical protein